METKPEFITVDQVAERLAVSYKTILRMIKEGHLNGVYRVGAQFRVKASAVDEYLERHKVSLGV